MDFVASTVSLLDFCSIRVWNHSEYQIVGEEHKSIPDLRTNICGAVVSFTENIPRVFEFLKDRVLPVICKI